MDNMSDVIVKHKPPISSTATNCIIISSGFLPIFGQSLSTGIGTVTVPRCLHSETVNPCQPIQFIAQDVSKSTCVREREAQIQALVRVAQY